MERSGNFYKAIRLGYILISILIGCMAYNSLYEWQEIEALELGNKKIDELRKEINNINIQMIKFSLLGETILEWNDKDIEHYHARRMAMDSMLCRFKVTYPASLRWTSTIPKSRKSYAWATIPTARTSTGRHSDCTTPAS